MVETDRREFLLEKRSELLREFWEALDRWFHGATSDADRAEIKSTINRNLMAVRNAVREAGTLKLMTIGPPPAIGGLVVRDVDPFENLFESVYGSSLIPAAMDCVDQAIGVYEHMGSDSGLVSIAAREAIDLETAFERALRPAFRRGPPENEREVQDAVENILIALGVGYSRETEVAPVGARGFKPDFTVENLDLALEVKLAKPGHGASGIQEEIAADISGYQTRWRHLLFVVYDIGVIDDPYAFRQENLRLFGVSVVVVKH